MDAAAYLTALRTEGARLSAAAREAGMDSPVPTCSGWTVADLLVHTARVFRHKTYVLEHRLVERPAGTDWNRDAPDPAESPAWFDEELVALAATLEAIDPSTPVWSFWPQEQTAAFWFRRMAQEAAVHRADAEAAAGDIGAVATDLAVDGIDEALDLFLVPRVEPGQIDGLPATVHLHATDAPGEWLVHLGPDGVSVERSHAKGDAAARGTASDLLLWLWGRVPVDRLEIFGDAVSVDRLRAVVAAVT